MDIFGWKNNLKKKSNIKQKINMLILIINLDILKTIKTFNPCLIIDLVIKTRTIHLK